MTFCRAQKQFMKSDQIYLKHIRDSIQDIGEAINEISFESFANNKIILKAVVRDLEIIGEVSNKLSQEFRDSNSHIPWRDMVDMRNILIHEYFGVIPESVWKTCRIDLPKLKKNIERLIVE